MASAGVVLVDNVIRGKFALYLETSDGDVRCRVAVVVLICTQSFNNEKIAKTCSYCPYIVYGC